VTIDQLAQSTLAQGGLLRLDTQINRTTVETSYIYHITLCDLDGGNMTFQAGESLSQTASECYSRWQNARAGIVSEPEQPPDLAPIAAEVAG
jgi:hypothetical protein